MLVGLQGLKGYGRNFSFAARAYLHYGFYNGVMHAPGFEARKLLQLRKGGRFMLAPERRARTEAETTASVNR